MMRSSVDFPEPLGPVMAIFSPAAMAERDAAQRLDPAIAKSPADLLHANEVGHADSGNLRAADVGADGDCDR